MNMNKVSTINGVPIVKTIEASNGKIFVIDKVLIPDDERTIIGKLERQGQFNTFLKAFNVAGLASTIGNGK